MIINCLVVDDEPVARQGLLEHIKEIDFLNPVGECKDALEASALLQKEKVDLVFLDIQMPKLTGIDFLKSLPVQPLVIFTTAYPQYAIEGYELDIVDYLLKPISFNRFLKAALKAQDKFYLQHKQLQPAADDFFFVKSGQKIEKINFADILYLEGMSNYIIIHTQQKKHVSYLTFKGIQEQLPKDQFIRTHKSFLVSVSAIQAIDGNEVILETGKIPISKNYKEGLMNRIEKNLFKR
ncbi:MAG: DNA-binding response regulator [Bacteroidetes bacterium 46-16]|nr:MAG: DNA-binding response regulator [Bacteroidetes bacterium 46-16]